VSPALSIASSHVGQFVQGQNGATYTLTISNAAGSQSTARTVSVSETMPTGLTLASMSGTGWSCVGNSYTTTTALAGARVTRRSQCK